MKTMAMMIINSAARSPLFHLVQEHPRETEKHLRVTLIHQTFKMYRPQTYSQCLIDARALVLKETSAIEPKVICASPKVHHYYIMA